MQKPEYDLGGQKHVACLKLYKISSCVGWKSVAYPGILFGWGGGVQQIQLRTEDKENGDQGVVAP